MAATEFPYWESIIPTRIGVPRATARAARKHPSGLIEGKHWAVVGNKICWSEQGVISLIDWAQKATGTDEGLEPVPQKNGAPEEPQQAAEPVLDEPPTEKPVHWVRVLKLVRNYHIILATHEGQMIRIRVRDNAKFVPGMEVPVRHLQKDLYELAGRNPRWRGKW